MWLVVELVCEVVEMVSEFAQSKRKFAALSFQNFFSFNFSAEKGPIRMFVAVNDVSVRHTLYVESVVNVVTWHESVPITGEPITTQ